MKEYAVKIDVIMSGTVYVNAESEQEAERTAKEMGFVASDLRNFIHIGTDVIETEENEE